MDLRAALRELLTVNPTSLSFGFGGRRADFQRTIRIQNQGEAGGKWKVDIDSADGVKATVEPAEMFLGPCEAGDVTVRFAGDLQPGEYQGFVLFRRTDAAAGERPQRIPYWYGVPTGIPASISVIPSAPATGTGGELVLLSVLITDAIGASTPAETPRVTVLEGSGTFVSAVSEDSQAPGYWTIRVRLGSVSGQNNRFRIEVGAMVREVAIRTR